MHEPGHASGFTGGERVIVKGDRPGRFARYAGKAATVRHVSPNGRVLELDFEDGTGHDFLGPDHVVLAPPAEDGYPEGSIATADPTFRTSKPVTVTHDGQERRMVTSWDLVGGRWEPFESFG